MIEKIDNFISKPWREKVKTFKFRWLKAIPVPLPVKLPCGAWWLAENDFCGAAIILDGFENAERWVFETLLQPGLNVIDIGAHHGFYTLAASIAVGTTGRVVAIEPSPREKNRLLRHLRLNKCRNVDLVNCALGSTEGKADLFVVEGTETGCNSLRPPNVAQPTSRLSVRLTTLDACLDRLRMQPVDFVKMDVEGAEIEVLKGAKRLLERVPRPLFMCEIQDIRTMPWGYRAGMIVEFLEERGFHWFSISATHTLTAVDSKSTEFDGNYIAVPDERIELFLKQLPPVRDCSTSI